MIKAILAACAAMMAIASNAAAGDGTIKKQSVYAFDDTLSHFEAALAERNIAVMTKIDHAGAAQNVDIDLRPTTLLIFGNPAIGSQLMAINQSIGLDLPLKALLFEDHDGAIWVEYNDIRYVAARHGLAGDHAVVARVAGALEAVSDAATKAEN